MPSPAHLGGDGGFLDPQGAPRRLRPTIGKPRLPAWAYHGHVTRSGAYHYGYGPYTAEHLFALPDEGKSFELVDGWLIELSPSSRHDFVANQLRRAIERASDQRMPELTCTFRRQWTFRLPLGSAGQMSE